MIVFGVWGVVKAFMTLLLDVDEYLVPESTALTRTQQIFAALIMLTIMASIIFMLHFYAGISAIHAGREGKHIKTCLFISASLLLLTITTIPLYFVNPPEEDLQDTAYVSAFSDVVFCIIIINMFYSMIRIKKLSEKEGS